MPDEPLFLLEVAHTKCVNAARTRLESGEVELPPELPRLLAEMSEGVPRPSHTLDRLAQIDACPFCDSQRDLTQEHVWPDWYSRELKARGVILTDNIVTNNRIDVIIPVCADCNNRWISVLENDCKQLLISMDKAAQGSKLIELSAKDQTRLATWAVKTAYLIDAYQAPVVPRGFFHQFALRRVPNAWTAAWVADYTLDVASRANKRALDFMISAGMPSKNSP